MVADITRGSRARCRPPSLIVLTHWHFSRLLVAALTGSSQGVASSARARRCPALMLVEPVVGRALSPLSPCASELDALLARLLSLWKIRSRSPVGLCHICWWLCTFCCYSSQVPCGVALLLSASFTRELLCRAYLYPRVAGDVLE